MAQAVPHSPACLCFCSRLGSRSAEPPSPATPMGGSGMGPGRSLQRQSDSGPCACNGTSCHRAALGRDAPLAPRFLAAQDTLPAGQLTPPARETPNAAGRSEAPSAGAGPFCCRLESFLKLFHGKPFGSCRDEWFASLCAKPMSGSDEPAWPRGICSPQGPSVQLHFL